MKNRSFAVTNAIAIVVVLYLARSAKTSAQITDVNARKMAPSFSLIDAAGAPVRLSDYKGRVVLLNFWATWCHGCKTEIPWYMEFQKNYTRRGLTVIGASMDDDGWKIVKPFVKAKKLNYPVVIASDALAKEYGLGAMPMSVLIDRNGRIADSHSGVVDQSAWEAEIRKLLDERQ